MQMNTCKSDDKVTVSKYVTPGYKRERLSTLVIEPRQYTGELPCIVFYHGGGLLLKASKVHYQIAKWYAQKAKCKVVLTDYSLLPKYRYPVAAEDCYNTYMWVVENSERLNINRDKIIVAGDSAGANLSVAVSLMLKDRNQKKPLGALLIYPVVDRRMITDSMKRYTDTPIWDAGLTNMFWREYLKGQNLKQLKYASFMETESFKCFPRAYIEVAEFDCLHDEGVAFAKKLQSEGITTELYEVNGAYHGFEVAFESTIVRNLVKRRIEWICSIF